MSKRDVYEAMRAQGMTYAQIAKVCGCSTQNVAQLLARRGESKFRGVTPDRCRWEGLRQWMNENKCGPSEILRQKVGWASTGSSSKFLREKLSGQRALRKKDIDFFRELTGLTYEQLFCSQEAED